MEAVESAFGSEIDYAMLVKIYGTVPEQQVRHSPAKCIDSETRVVTGDPDINHVSTSYVERQNLTMRMSMRRFTRLTNAFSKKLENHMHAISLHYMYYNFGGIHQSLRVTPAMEAGISDHVWSLEEIAEMACFLLSDAASCVNGQAIAVDGGLSASHPWAFRRKD